MENRKLLDWNRKAMQYQEKKISQMTVFIITDTIKNLEITIRGFY